MRVGVGAFLALEVVCLRGRYAEVQERTVFLTRFALKSLGTERSCVLAERRLMIDSSDTFSMLLKFVTHIAIEVHNSNRK
jgi:hypothetical protein